MPRLPGLSSLFCRGQGGRGSWSAVPVMLRPLQRRTLSAWHREVCFSGSHDSGNGWVLLCRWLAVCPSRTNACPRVIMLAEGPQNDSQVGSGVAPQAVMRVGLEVTGNLFLVDPVSWRQS